MDVFVCTDSLPLASGTNQDAFPASHVLLQHDCSIQSVPRKTQEGPTLGFLCPGSLIILPGGKSLLGARPRCRTFGDHACVCVQSSRGQNSWRGALAPTCMQPLDCLSEFREIPLSTGTMLTSKKLAATAQLLGCRILPDKFFMQAAVPTDISPHYPSHWGKRRSVQWVICSHLIWLGAFFFFAHEEIWPFLSYLNVVPKCLPAIVA